MLQRKNWSHVADTGKAARSITVSLAFCIFEGDSVQQGDIQPLETCHFKLETRNVRDLNPTQTADSGCKGDGTDTAATKRNTVPESHSCHRFKPLQRIFLMVTFAFCDRSLFRQAFIPRVGGFHQGRWETVQRDG